MGVTSNAASPRSKNFERSLVVLLMKTAILYAHGSIIYSYVTRPDFF
jgi:hypothetical protein